MSDQDGERPAGGNRGQPRLTKQLVSKSYKYEKKWDTEDYITCNGVTILLPVLDPNEYERSVYFEMNIVKVTALKFGYRLDAIFTKGAYVLGLRNLLLETSLKMPCTQRGLQSLVRR